MSDTSLPTLSQQAINSSLSGDWKKALRFNQQILIQDSEDISALNRLGKAQEKLGQITAARRTYKQVLQQDQYNNIAANNLRRLKGKKTNSNSHPTPPTTFSFIEEPGKTKVIHLTKLAPQNILSSSDISEVVQIKPQKRRVGVYNQNNKYLGSFPDDFSLYFIKLVNIGNKFEAAIKTLSKNRVEIFIRETHRSKRLKGHSPFPLKDNKHYYNLLSTDPISEIPLQLQDPEIPTE